MDILDTALRDWKHLNQVLPKLREDQVLVLLEREKLGKQRVLLLERLHQRYSSLRTQRERKEMVNDLL